MKVIIIEGENKCGKSTLARYIVDNFGYEYIKCSQPKGNAYDEYLSIIKNLKEDNNYVIDRFMYGEMVYGPIYRGKSDINPANLYELENLIYGNAVVIYCYDTVSNISKRYKEDNEEWADINKIKQTLELFEKVIKLSMLPVYRHKMKSDKDLISTKKINNILSI